MWTRLEKLLMPRNDFRVRFRSFLRKLGFLPKGDSLLEYRLWLKLVEECSDLYDDLEHTKPSLSPEQFELIDHVCNRLLGILERSDVEVIRNAGVYDRRYHIPFDHQRIEEGQTINVISPGLVIGRRVLRHAQVTGDEGSTVAGISAKEGES